MSKEDWIRKLCSRKFWAAIAGFITGLLIYFGKTAQTAASLKNTTQSFGFFTTTLTISPLKDAQRLNAIGLRMAQEYGLAWLPSDFKKKDGYKRSIELSREFDLYRQNYCGCVFSKRDSEKTVLEKSGERL